MRLIIDAAAALALTMPVLAAADDAAAPAAVQPVKEKKLCRFTPPPTGKRRCRTAAQCRETRETRDVEAGTNGAPARSQPQNQN